MAGSAVIGAGAAAVAAVAGAAADRWWRARVRRQFEAEHRRRFRMTATGVVAGAEPFTLTGARDRAVLILHGFNDTPQSMAALAARLHARGWTARVPLLPGHGVGLAEMAAASRAAAWRAAVRAEYDALRRTHARVAVVGQSMGGALAVLLAAERPEIPALVLLAPYVGMPRPLQWQVAAAWLAQAVMPYRASTGGETSIHDPRARVAGLGPGVVTARTLTELRRVAEDAESMLPSLAVPTLYLQSREDNRIAAPHAAAMFRRLGSADKRLHWLTGCGHIISDDYCRDEVAEETARWIDEHGASSLAIGGAR
jgi:carboxylesterase